MTAIAMSIVLIVLSSIFQGTYGLGLRKFAPLPWEMFWLVYSVAGMIVLPCVWAEATIPNMFAAIASVPLGTILAAMIFGASWGVGMITFGLGLRYLGVSLSYGIATGLTAAVGSLVPLLQRDNVADMPSLKWILAGNVVMALGVLVITAAGIARDRVFCKNGEQTPGIHTGRWFWIGIFLSILSGFAWGLMNVGFTAAKPLADAAIAQGATPRNASLLQWVMVFAGGFLVNIGCAVVLLIRNRSYRAYRSSGTARGYLVAVITAAAWFLSMLLYGQGTAFMGDLGPVVGWTMFLTLSLVVCNACGIVANEWKSAPGPLRIVVGGNLILVISSVILGYASSL